MVDKILIPIDDDTEEAPWIVMGDAQWRAATILYASLDLYGRTQTPPWYVAGMLPISYHPERGPRTETLAPISWWP